MTIEEARKIAAIVATTDGGCTVCIGDLIGQLNKKFPEFEFSMCDNWWNDQEIIVKEKGK